MKGFDQIEPLSTCYPSLLTSSSSPPEKRLVVNAFPSMQEPLNFAYTNPHIQAVSFPGYLDAQKLQHTRKKEIPHLFPTPIKCAIRNRTVRFYIILLHICTASIKLSQVSLKLSPNRIMVDNAPALLEADLFRLPLVIHEINALYMSSFLAEELQAVYFAAKEMENDERDTALRRAAKTFGRMYFGQQRNYWRFRCTLDESDDLAKEKRRELENAGNEKLTQFADEFIQCYDALRKAESKFANISRVFDYSMNVTIESILANPDVVKNRLRRIIDVINDHNVVLAVSDRDIIQRLPDYDPSNLLCRYYFRSCPMDEVFCQSGPFNDYFHRVSCPRPGIYLPDFPIEMHHPVFTIFANPLGYQFVFHSQKVKGVPLDLIEPVLIFEAIREQIIMGDGLHCPSSPRCYKSEGGGHIEDCFARQVLSAIWETTKNSQSESIKWKKPLCLEGTLIKIDFNKKWPNSNPYSVFTTVSKLFDALNLD